VRKIQSLSGARYSLLGLIERQEQWHVMALGGLYLNANTCWEGGRNESLAPSKEV
jgi:hypothetical protein